jgi:hypothetical protein
MPTGQLTRSETKEHSGNRSGAEQAHGSERAAFWAALFVRSVIYGGGGGPDLRAPQYLGPQPMPPKSRRTSKTMIRIHNQVDMDVPPFSPLGSRAARS